MLNNKNQSNLNKLIEIVYCFTKIGGEVFDMVCKDEIYQITGQYIDEEITFTIENDEVITNLESEHAYKIYKMLKDNK